MSVWSVIGHRRCAGPAGRRRGSAVTSSATGTRSPRAVGQVQVARAVVQRRHARRDVLPQVAARGDGPLRRQRRRRRRSTAWPDGGQQRVAGRQLAAGERAAGPGQPDRVLGQPRMGGAEGREPGLERLPGGLDRFARAGRRSDPPRPAGRAPSWPSRRPARGRSRCRTGTARPRSAGRRPAGARPRSPAARRARGRTVSTALTPWSRIAACAAGPVTSSRKVSAPALAVTTACALGSGMTQTSPRWPRRRVAHAPRPPSSSPTTPWIASGRTRSTPAARIAASAPRDATTPAFMSQAPRPCTAPSAMRGTNGSPSHCARSPGGTTSVCPESTSAGTPSSAAGTVPTTPHASVRSTSWPGASASVAAACRSIGHVSTSQSSSSSQPASRCWTSLSAGGAADRGDGDHPAQPVDQPLLVDGVESPGLRAGQVGHGRSLARASARPPRSGALA